MTKATPKVYKTERAAKKFLAACVAKYPDKDFFITTDPYGTFGYCVAFFSNNPILADKAYYMSALKGFRP